MIYGMRRAWVNVFKEFAEAMGMEVDMNKLFGTLYNKALEGDPDCAQCSIPERPAGSSRGCSGR